MPGYGISRVRDEEATCRRRFAGPLFEHVIVERLGTSDAFDVIDSDDTGWRQEDRDLAQACLNLDPT